MVENTVTVTCDMEASCTEPVTHMDDKGYVYCTSHGLQRRSVRPCRRLYGWERAEIQRGALRSYKPYTFKEHLRVFYPEEYARRFNANPD